MDHRVKPGGDGKRNLCPKGGEEGALGGAGNFPAQTGIGGRCRIEPTRDLCVISPFPPPRATARRLITSAINLETEEKIMVITAAHLTPLVAIVAGLLILIIPRLLSYIVAIYLIFTGFVELNAVHHWINFH